MVRMAKSFMLAICDNLALDTVSGEGNYMMIKVPINDMMMYRRLMKRGMMVRTMTGFRFPGWIRITLREKSVMELFAEALQKEIKSIQSTGRTW